jgi:hypothetical protein
MVELRGLEPLTFSLRRLRLPRTGRLRASSPLHTMRRDGLCRTSGAHRGYTPDDRFYAIDSQVYLRAVHYRTMTASGQNHQGWPRG